MGGIAQGVGNMLGMGGGRQGGSACGPGGCGPMDNGGGGGPMMDGGPGGCGPMDGGGGGGCGGGRCGGFGNDGGFPMDRGDNATIGLPRQNPMQNQNQGWGGMNGPNGMDPFAPDPNLEKSDYAQRVLALVNVERAKVGAPALGLDETLGKVARDHSQKMANENFFDHFGPDGSDPWSRMAAAGVRNPGSENIAMGQPTPEEAVASWMESPGHRENLLDPNWHKIGVGVAVAGGQPKWTQTFAA